MPHCVDVSNAHRRTRINGLHKIVQLHVSMVRDFRECGDCGVPRNIGFVRGPIGSRRRPRVLDKGCQCILDALGQLDFVGGSRQCIQRSEDNMHYASIKTS